MNYLEFISAEKSLLKAPAGYGKTYTLAECIKYCPDNQKQLILTHTNAGIASINEKLRELEIDSSKCHINTICGFAQKYVLSLCNNSDLPPQESKQYFEAVVEKAIALFNLESVKRIVKCSYDGLFVDEYQDCSKSQHNMIMALAEVLPTHILGDPMQGIFNFNGTLVDIDHDLKDIEYQLSLDTPWRWKKEGNNEVLGESLRVIRGILKSDNRQIDLSAFHGDGFYYYKFKEEDIYEKNSDYREYVIGLIENPNNKPELESLLFVVPDVYKYSNLNARNKIRTSVDFTRQLTLLEAIDEKDYYAVCSNIDDLVDTIDAQAYKINTIRNMVLLELFNKTNVDEWFNDNNLINRRKPHKQNCVKLKSYMDAFLNEPSLHGIYSIILFLKKELKFKTTRREKLESVLKAIKTAIEEGMPVYEAMSYQKNRLRRMGRKIYGKCIGTALLTKGLEFDTVVVLNAHRFESYKHFYVAITRACKKLVVFSEKKVLEF